MKHYTTLTVPTDSAIGELFPDATRVQAFVNILALQRGTNEIDHQPIQLNLENFAQTVADTLSSLSAYTAYHKKGKPLIVRRFGREMIHVIHPEEHRYRSHATLTYAQALEMVKVAYIISQQKNRANKDEERVL